MVYYPRRDNLGPFLHREWEDDALINSRRGNTLAKSLGFSRVDNDFVLTKDGLWANMHGWPSMAFGTTRGRQWTWDQLNRISEGRVRTGLRAIRDALALNQSIEWEVKYMSDVTEDELVVAFDRLARMAERNFGRSWIKHRRVVVKVLTNLSGGEKYALMVCRAAHRANVPTMLLVRGRCVWKSYKNHTEITYIRGSRNLHIR